MPTIEERNVFTDNILAPVGADANLKPYLYQSNLTGFLAKVGEIYLIQGDRLMAIGRAVNGWGDYDIYPKNLCQQESRNNFADRVVQWAVNNEYNEDFNAANSQFGRVLRGVVGELQIENYNDTIWSSYLVWSNLYKLSPSRGGNPCQTLRNAQRSGCIELLQVELTTYLPNHLLFLTGLEGWADQFWADFGIDNAPMPIDPNFEFVEKFGRLTHNNNQLCKVVIACHPRSKPRNQWVNEVMTAFHRLSDEAI